MITVHNEIINLILKENSDSSKTSLNQGLKDFVKDEIPDTQLKSVTMKPIGQGRKIIKSHQGCNRIWMHYEHEVQGYMVCTDSCIEKWKIVANIKFEIAANQKSKLTIICCMLKFDRNFISLWDRMQTLDMEHNEKMNKLKLSQTKLSPRGDLNQN